jgi:hypothetical protein
VGAATGACVGVAATTGACGGAGAATGAGVACALSLTSVCAALPCEQAASASTTVPTAMALRAEGLPNIKLSTRYRTRTSASTPCHTTVPIHDDPDIEEPSQRQLSAGRNAHSSRPVLTRISLIADDAGLLPALAQTGRSAHARCLDRPRQRNAQLLRSQRDAIDDGPRTPPSDENAEQVRARGRRPTCGYIASTSQPSRPTRCRPSRQRDYPSGRA